MNHWHKYPFVRILLPFLFGIIVVINWTNKLSYIIVILIGIFLISLFFFFNIKSYKWRNLFGINCFVLFVLFGMLMADLKLSSPPKSNSDLYLAEFQICAQPEVLRKNVRAVCKTNIVFDTDSIRKEQLKVIVYFPKDTIAKQLQYGDYLYSYSKLLEIEPPLNKEMFNYKRYLGYRNIHYQAFLKNKPYTIISRDRGNRMISEAIKIRQYLLNRLEYSGLKSEELGIASALLLGYDDNLDKETQSEFSNAGAMHILCVSGLHIGIIYLVLTKLLSFFHKIKKGIIIKYILILVLLWIYALITAFSPSVLRATTMFSLIIIGKCLQRNINIYNSIAASALLLLLINPLMIMEVGFQLSYIAVIGIVAIYQILDNTIKIKNRIIQKIKDLIIVSLAAQIATFPLSVYYFHQFPNYFLLTNLVVVSMAGVLLYIGFTYLLFAGIPFLGDILSTILKVSFWFLHEYVGMVNDLPMATLNNLTLSCLAVMLIYLMIFCFFRSLSLRSGKLLIFSMFFLLMLGSLYSYRIYQVSHQYKYIVYHRKNEKLINLVNGRSSYSIGDSILLNDSQFVNFTLHPYWRKYGIEKNINIDLKINIYDDKVLFKYKKFIRINNMNFLFANDEYDHIVNL